MIGYIVSTWPRLSQTFVLNEVLALERHGVPLRIFSVKNPRPEPVHREAARVRAKVTYLSFGPHWKAILKANFRLLRARPGRYCRTLLQALGYFRTLVLKGFFQAGYLADKILREPVSQLHAHFASAPTTVAMFVHELTGTPFSFTAHARDIYVSTKPVLLRAKMKRARSIVTVSEYNRRHLVSVIGNGLVNGAKVHCIYNGLDLSQFPFRRPGAGDRVPPIILSVARLVEKKGMGDLVKAAAILRRQQRSFRLEIIGSGRLASALAAEIKRQGLAETAELLGPQPQEMVRAAYLRASIFALPCLVTADGDRDGIPTVLLEAMASGLPVVSTPVSGIPELIESGYDGLLVPPGDPVALAGAIERLLADPSLRASMAREARAKIESSFTLERSSQQLIALFRQGEEQ